MTKPTEKQIRDEAQRFAGALGGAINLTGGNLSESVDAKFPGMTDSEFVEIWAVCTKVADEMRASASAKMWAT